MRNISISELISKAMMFHLSLSLDFCFYLSELMIGDNFVYTQTCSQNSTFTKKFIILFLKILEKHLKTVS